MQGGLVEANHAAQATDALVTALVATDRSDPGDEKADADGSRCTTASARTLGCRPWTTWWTS